MSQSKARKETVARVMHEFKEGELETSQGNKVTDSKQAIALREAGAANKESEADNNNLRRAKQRESGKKTAASG